MDYDEFLATFAYDKIADLSATTVALCLSAITLIKNREDWSDNGNALTDSQWDNIENIVALGTLELMSSLVGVIFPSVMATISAFKFLPCDGGIYNKSDFPLLYEAIDPTFIISGTQFFVPDMRSRFPVGTGGAYALNDTGGSDSVTLSTGQIPPHSHGYDQVIPSVDIGSAGVPIPSGVSQPFIPAITGSSGGGGSHENRPPFVALNYIIVAG